MPLRGKSGSAPIFDGTRKGEQHEHGPGSMREGEMGQREDVQRSLALQAETERHEVYVRRVQAREGWRARLANVERLLSGALEPGAIGVAVRGFTRGEMADMEMALTEVRSMLDGDFPLIGPSQRAPVEIHPVRESQR